MTQVIKLTQNPWTLKELRLIAETDIQLDISADIKAAVSASAAVVHKVLQQQQAVYGINTGFGALANQRIADAELAQLQENIVLSHACGVGEYVSEQVSKLVFALKLKSLAQGYSGVSLGLFEYLLKAFNLGIYPCMPEKGSVGASGDLAPLAHFSLAFLGQGEIYYQQAIKPAEAVLQEFGLATITLGPKEGLALLNGTQVSTAMALSAYFATEDLFQQTLIVGALTVDACAGSDAPFHPAIQQAGHRPGQMQVAARLRDLLQGSAIRASHVNCDRVQDPYSLRCQPQVMGACLEQMNFVKTQLLTESQAVSDNPLVFAEHDAILSGGNFHAESVAMAADNLALAIAEMGALSERRMALLIDKNMSGLPAFLVKDSGLNSGFMMAQVTAAALASDNKMYAHPACVDSLPTSANQEDHVSMATNGARRLFAMLDNAYHIVAIEMLAAIQGIELRAPLATSPQLQQIIDKVRAKIAHYDNDRYFAPDITLLKQQLSRGEFL